MSQWAGDVPPGGKGLAEYLAKYVVSPPVSVRRIEEYDGQQVSYWYKDHKTDAIQHTTLPGFPRRNFALHLDLFATPRQQFFAVAVRPDAVATDAHETVGQGRQQQAARWSSRFSVRPRWRIHKMSDDPR